MGERNGGSGLKQIRLGTFQGLGLSIGRME